MSLSGLFALLGVGGGTATESRTLEFSFSALSGRAEVEELGCLIFVPFDKTLMDGGDGSVDELGVRNIFEDGWVVHWCGDA
jgi:hypothetical protein